MDVRRLNISLLLWFREGVAAALGVPAGQVHISRLNVRLLPSHIGYFCSSLNHLSYFSQEEKNAIELFVSSDRPGRSEPRPAEEVIQALNVGVLHRHLGHLGITEISTEVCVQSSAPQEEAGC